MDLLPSTYIFVNGNVCTCYLTQLGNLTELVNPNLTQLGNQRSVAAMS